MKIGRATNVHRRMTQWQKQCGHDITLLRYYPNVNVNPDKQFPRSASSTPHPILTPTPLLPRIERLIQLELAGLRIKQEKCDACGREHREWFEVEASRNGVRCVDEVVRRWVEWGMREGQGEEDRDVKRGERGRVGTGDAQQGYY